MNKLSIRLFAIVSLYLWAFVHLPTSNSQEVPAVDPSEYRMIKISEAPTLVPQLVLDSQGFTEPIHRLAISNNGEYLAAAADKVVRIWDLNTRALLGTLRGYQEPYGYELGFIDTLTFSPDSRFLVVGVHDNYEAGSTRVYDLSEPEKLKNLVPGHLGCTRGVTFSNSGALFATWGCDGNIIVYDWDSTQGTAQERFRAKYEQFVGLPEQYIYTFQFSADDRYLVFSEACGCGAIEIKSEQLLFTDNQTFHGPLLAFGWDTSSTSKSRIRLDTSEIELLFDKGTSRLVRPAFKYALDTAMPEELWGVFAGYSSNNESGKFWAATWNRTGAVRGIHKHDYEVQAVTWNSQAKLAASSDSLGEIHIWDPNSGQLVTPPIMAKGQPIWSVFWDNEGTGLRFATDYARPPKWQYNNYGEIDSKFDLFNMVMSECNDNAPRQDTRVLTRESGRSLLLHRKSDQGNFGLLFDFGTITARFVNAFKAANFGKAGRAHAEWRNDAYKNFSVRLAYHFPEIFFYRAIDYPGIDHSPSFLLGSIGGDLVEGYFDTTEAGPEFRITKKFLGHSSRITGADVSPDRRFLATSALDGTIRVWPLRKAEIFGDFDFATDGSSIIAIPEGGESARAGLEQYDVVQFVDDTTFFQRVMAIRDGKLKPGQVVNVTVSRETSSGTSQLTKKVKLVDAPQVVEPLLSFFLARDNQWVIWTQSGHYNSSPRGAQYIGWHINQKRFQPAQFHASERFEKQLYQPEIVRSTFLNSNSADAIEQLESDFGPSVLANATLPTDDPQAFETFLPPEIQIVTPSRNARIYNNELSIKARIMTPADVSIRSTRLLIDGRNCPGSLGTLRSGNRFGDQQEVWLEQLVSLRPGKHHLELSVETSNFVTQSREIEFVVESNDETKPESAVTPSRLFVLAVGISDYVGEDLDLECADNDAIEFAKMWKEREGDVFTTVETQVLTNEHATVSDIKERGLEWLLEKSLTVDDTVIVFLGGHGFFDRYDEWYFGGHELDVERLSTTGISDAELKSFFGKLPTNTILFTDSCFASSFQLPKEIRTTPRSGKNIWRGQGKIAYSSCLPHEQSLESASLGHGIFTKAILEYFEEPAGDVDGDGFLSCMEMAVFVNKRVREITNGVQNPSLEFPSGVSDVVFGTARRALKRK